MEERKLFDTNTSGASIEDIILNLLQNGNAEEKEALTKYLAEEGMSIELAKSDSKEVSPVIAKPVVRIKDEKEQLRSLATQAVIEAIKMNDPKYDLIIRWLVRHHERMDLGKFLQLYNLKKNKLDFLRDYGLQDTPEQESYLNFSKNTFNKMEELLTTFIAKNSNIMNSKIEQDEFDELNNALWLLFEEEYTLGEENISTQLRVIFNDMDSQAIEKIIQGVIHRYRSKFQLHWPTTIEEFHASPYHMNDKKIKELQEEFANNITLFELNADSYLQQYEAKMAEFTEEENQIHADNQAIKKQEIANLFVKEEGIYEYLPPCLCFDELTVDQLFAMKGLVEKNAVDEMNHTLLTIARRFDNESVEKFIYLDCSSYLEELCNSGSLAYLYGVPKDAWKGYEHTIERQQLKLGNLYAKVEQLLLTYKKDWIKRDTEWKNILEDSSVFSSLKRKLLEFQDKLFGTVVVFEQREKEVNEFLDFINQEQWNQNPSQQREVYELLIKKLRRIPKGALNGSTLYGGMKNYFNQIDNVTNKQLILYQAGDFLGEKQAGALKTFGHFAKPDETNKDQSVNVNLREEETKSPLQKKH